MRVCSLSLSLYHLKFLFVCNLAKRWHIHIAINIWEKK
jgi:hypothetical protein